MSTIRRRRVYTTAASSSSSSSLFSTSRTRNQNPRRKKKTQGSVYTVSFGPFHLCAPNLRQRHRLDCRKRRRRQDHDRPATEKKKREQRSDPPSPLLTKLIIDSSPTKNLDNNSSSSSSRRRRRDGVAIARLHGQPFDWVGFCLGWGPRPCALRAASPSPLSRTHSDANDGNTHSVEQSQCFFRNFCS